MNALPTLGPWSAALGWLALEAAIVVLAALALQPLLRAAATRRSLWRAVLVSLALLLAAEFTGATSQLSAQLRTAWQTTFPKPAPPELPGPPPEPTAAFPISHFPSPIPSFEFIPEPLTPAPPPTLPPPHHSTTPPLPPPIPVWPALLWLTGLAALLARSAWTHSGFAWLRLRHFLPAAEALRERVQSLAARLGLRRRVRVLASERLRAPAAFGWLRPGVGVPGDFTDRFAPAQQDVMLAHELAHLAARDPLWQLLADLVTAALWWHPLAWVARRQHRIAGELAADDASLALPNGPVVLAECLLALGHEAADCPRAALGMAGFRSQLGRRVERLLALPRRDWQAPSRARLALQTAVALLALAALALLPGCAANRTASEAPSGIVAKWWQAKKAPVGDDVRSLQLNAERGTRNAESSQSLVTSSPSNAHPVVIQGRVLLSGTPPTEQRLLIPQPIVVRLATRAKDLELRRKDVDTNYRRATDEYKRLAGSASEPNVGIQERAQRQEAAEAQLREVKKQEILVSEFDRAGRAVLSAQQASTTLTTRFHVRSPDGGLGDVLVYVQSGLEGQTFAAPSNSHVIRVVGFEFHPYVTAVQAGQSIRWESQMPEVMYLHPTPTNRANPEFGRGLLPGRFVEAAFPGLELFLRIKVDVYPWLLGYVCVLPHPFFAVTDAEGRFRFPRPLPPGKYTLAAVHRQTAEVVRELDLTQPALAGQPPEIEFVLSTKAVASYVVEVGDRLRVEVYKRDDLRSDARVQADGTILLPLIKAVPVASKTLSAARDAIQSAYEQSLNTQADVSVTLVESAPPLTPPPVLSTPVTPAAPGPARPSNPALAREHCDRLDALVRTIRANPATTAQDYANVAGLIEQALAEYTAVIPPTTPELARLKRLLSETKPSAPKPGTSLSPVGPPAASKTTTLDISVGRQLFVDDFLIASNSLMRAWHKPTFFADTPLVRLPTILVPPGPLPVCDRVWYDTSNQLFKMRFATSNGIVAVFHSPSGTNWVRGESNAVDPRLRFPLAGPLVQYATLYESLSLIVSSGELYHSSTANKDGSQAFGLLAQFGRGSGPGRTERFLGEGPFLSAPKVPAGAKWEDIYPSLDGFLVVGRNLYFYYGGRITLAGERQSLPAVGLATLRRDGFASLDAGPEGGVMTTKPVTFTGKFMFVNMKTNAADGEMRIEILDADGNALERFSRAKCIPLAADQTLMGVSWQSQYSATNDLSGLAGLAGQPVRFRFHLKNASLYSFWVGPGQLGRSMGRVAGGGPHFTNDVDTIGNASYRTFPVVRTNAVIHHQPTVEKLARIRFPELTYDCLPLPFVLKMLEQDTKKYDPAKQGVSFGMRALHEVTVFESTVPGREISVPFRTLDVTQAQSAGSGTVGVSFNATVPLPRARVRQVAIDNMDTVLIKVTSVLRGVSVLDALDAIVKTSEAAIGYTVETNRVVIHPRLPGREFVSPRVSTNAPGAALRAKAEKIIQPQVIYDGLPLPEVIKFLLADTRKFDTDKQGVNFLATSGFPDLLPGARPAQPPVLDSKGNPIAAVAAHRPDMDTVIIRLGNLRTNQTLLQVLDAICAAANEPITYRLEDYAVLITPKYPGTNTPADHATQTLGVMPIRLLTALARELGRDAGQLSTNDTVLNGLLTEYLAPRGFATPPGQPPVFRVLNGRVHYTGLRSQSEDFARLLYKLERSVPAPPRPAPAKQPEPAKSPNPGAFLPLPAPVAADVRRLTPPQTPDAKAQTPPASQSLLTSAATNKVAAPDPVQAALEKTLLRQERRIAMEKLLGEAGQFQKVKSWTNAVVRYEEGLLLAPPLNGPFGAPLQVTDAINGLNYCRLQIAIEHKQRSEFAQATALADEVLALDPANDFARLIKQLVERVSKPTPSGAAVSVDAADQAKAERLIASTRLRLDQNNTRDALQNLWAALLTNPRSDADSSMLLLLLDKRFEDERVRLAGTRWGRVVEVSKKWTEATRQERMLAMEKLLDEAGQFLKVKSWTNAVVRYEEAVGLAKELGGVETVEKQYRNALAGLIHCRLQLAVGLQENYQFKAAAAEADKILPFDSKNADAEQFKRFNERVEAAHKGRMPSQGDLTLQPKLSAQRAEIMQLVRDGQLYWQMGEHAQAKKSLESAIAKDPLNEAAFFYLRLVMEAEFAIENKKRDKTYGDRVVEVSKWNESPRTQNGLPVPNPYFRTNSQVPFLTHSSKGAQRINRKLEEIVLPEVHFDGVPLVGVVQRLMEDAKKFDPEKKGLNFLINDVAPAAPLLDAAGNPVPVARPVTLSEGLIRISTPLKNLTLRQALDVICKTAELPTQFSVEEYAIVFIPRGPGNTAFFSRTFRVNPDTFMQGLRGVVANPVLGVGAGQASPAAGAGATTGPVRATVPATVPATPPTTAEANALVRQFFQSAGVTSLAATNSSTQVIFNPENGLLLVRGTTNDLRVIEQAIQKVQPPLLTPTNAAPRTALPNPYYRTNNSIPFLTHSSKGAQIINRKLDEIILPQVQFDSMTLPEVVKWLDGAVKKFDPEKKGLNFMINNVVVDYISLNDAKSGKPAAPVLDPLGNPIASPAAKAPKPDLDNALIKVTKPIKDLTLRQVLDVICKTATVKMPDGRTAGLKFTIEEYAIVFSPKLPEQASLFARTFKVDPETFIRGLRSVTSRPVPQAGKAHSGGWSGPVIPNMSTNLDGMLRDYFRAAGVSNLGVTNGPDATQVFFNDRNGLLLVRASLEDLDIIQQAIELLNTKPPQVLIEAKFVVMDQNDNKAVGFDWFMGNTRFGDFAGRPGAAPATAPPDGIRRVWIDREGNYKLDGRARSLDQIEDELKAVSRTNAGVVVRIGAEHESRYSDATPVFERLSRIGVTNSSYAVQPELSVLSKRPPSAANPTGVFPLPASPGGAPAVTGSVTTKLVRTNSPPLGTITGILTAPQFAVVMRALEQRDAASVRPLPKVTTPSGKQAVLELPAAAKAGAGAAQGLKLEVLPTVGADGYTVNLTVIVSQDRRLTFVSECVVWDAQTLMVGGLELPGAASKPGAKPPRLVLFLTPTLVDATGNRIHATTDEMPFAPAAPAKPSAIEKK